jgi:acyl carrier protein
MPVVQEPAVVTGLDRPPPSLDGLAGLAALLAQATGEDAGWAAEVRADALLEADLGLDSLELADLSELLRSRYGPRADLLPWLAGLDLEQIIGLTVADLAERLDDVRRADSSDNGKDRA